MTREELSARSKRCSLCGDVKSGSEFTIFKTTRGTLALMARCKPCRSTTVTRYREDHPEYAEASRQYSRDYGTSYARERQSDSMANNQSKSLEGASNNYKEWTGPELEIVYRDDLTAVQMAKLLNRTYHSVRKMRAKCKLDPRKQMLAGIERTEL